MQTSIKLYYSPGACSLATHILLRETGTPFTLEKVDTGKHTTSGGGDFYAFSPKGQVPVIELRVDMGLQRGKVVIVAHEAIGAQRRRRQLHHDDIIVAMEPRALVLRRQMVEPVRGRKGEFLGNAIHHCAPRPATARRQKSGSA